MQGLSLDGALMPSLATARVPVATLSSPADYGFGSHNVWDVVRRAARDAIGSLGAPRHRPRPGARAGQPHRQAGRRAAPPARPLRRQGRPGAHQPQGEVPGHAISARASPASPRSSTRTSRSAPPPSPAPAPTTRTPTSRAPAGRRQADRRRALRPSRPTSSGGASRAVCSRSSGASSAAAPSRTTRTAPTTARPGLAFLMGTKVRQHMVGEFPGLTKGLDKDGNLRATSDFRSVYSSLVEQWFDVDAARIIPDAAQDAANEAGRMMRRVVLVARRSRSPASPPFRRPRAPTACPSSRCREGMDADASRARASAPAASASSSSTSGWTTTTSCQATKAGREADAVQAARPRAAAPSGRSG